MRLSHIVSHIEQQLTLSEVIFHTYDDFIKDGLTGVTSRGVHARLSTLNEDWERFSLTQRAITIANNELSEEEKSILNEHPYFTSNVVVTTHKTYKETVEKLNTLLEQDQENTSTNSASMASSGMPASSTSANCASITSSGMPVFIHHARLPRINLPDFNGSQSDWLSFKDLFQSLVINVPTLSPVEKLQYLKTHLTGSAAALLKNTTLTADNFSKSWDALVDYYENKRLLVHAALQSLFSLKRMTKESASELERLYTNVMQSYRTLEALQRPVNHNDDFFVFITISRLDSESVKVWEQRLGSSKRASIMGTALRFPHFSLNVSQSLRQVPIRESQFSTRPERSKITLSRQI